MYLHKGLTFMGLENVLFEESFIRKTSTTYVTSKRFFPSMGSHVSCQVPPLAKCHTTQSAFIWSFPSMGHHV